MNVISFHYKEKQSKLKTNLFLTHLTSHPTYIYLILDPDQTEKINESPYSHLEDLKKKEQVQKRKKIKKKKTMKMKILKLNIKKDINFMIKILNKIYF